MNLRCFGCRLRRGNFLPNISDGYIKKCNFDLVNNTYCPIFRVGDVVHLAQQNFTKLADKVEIPFGTKPWQREDVVRSKDKCCNFSYAREE